MTDLEKYQQQLHARLKSLAPIFAKAAIGDFSGQVQIPAKEDELTEFYVGVQIILDTIREKVAELETSLEDLRAANDVIAREKARVEAILDGLGEGLLTVDETWHVTYINQPAVSLLGERAWILGQDVTDIMRLEGANGKAISDQKHPIVRAIESRRQLTVNLARGPEYYVVVAGGQRRRIGLTITPIRLASKVAGAAVALRDITEEGNIDRAKSEIISIASHQLRTPLTAIRWYAAALLHEHDITPVQRTRYLQQIHDSNQHMLEMVDALLNVSRIDLGTLELTPSEVDVKLSLREVLKELAVEISAKQLDVQQQLNSELRPVVIDPNALHIILLNLVSNAVKYSPKKGVVAIGVQQQTDNTLVEVRDQGCGIPAGQQSKIFTKLFRADNAVKVATDGTGLGLYVTKAMLERAGGQIWFESVENHGSTFYATIPSKKT